MSGNLPEKNNIDRLIDVLSAISDRLDTFFDNQIDQIMDPDEAAAFLKIKRASLMQLARDGEIPSAKVGDKPVRFHKEELAQWIRSGGSRKHEKVIPFPSSKKAKSRVRNGH